MGAIMSVILCWAALAFTGVFAAMAANDLKKITSQTPADDAGKILQEIAKSARSKDIWISVASFVTLVVTLLITIFLF